MFRKILATVGTAAALSGVAAVPAFAAPHPFTVTVNIDDEHGVLTTAAPLQVGEVLSGFGYVTGTFTVTSITPDGPVDRVTLSPAPQPPQSSEVLSFHIVSL